jgi:hypothetical protein
MERRTSKALAVAVVASMLLVSLAGPAAASGTPAAPGDGVVMDSQITGGGGGQVATDSQITGGGGGQVATDSQITGGGGGQVTTDSQITGGGTL